MRGGIGEDRFISGRGKRACARSRIGSRAPGDGGRGHGPPAAGAPQPAHERHQIHRTGRGQPHHIPQHGRGSYRSDRFFGPGHRHRNPARAAGEALPKLQPTGCIDNQALRGHRPRAGDLAASRPDDGRMHRGRVRAGKRIDISVFDPVWHSGQAGEKAARS